MWENVSLDEISSVQGNSKHHGSTQGGGWGDALDENVNKVFFLQICHH